jgi:hypothetical protein
VAAVGVAGTGAVVLGLLGAVAEAESAAMRQQFEQALAEERNLRAQQRLEAQAEALELYRQ